MLVRTALLLPDPLAGRVATLLPEDVVSFPVGTGRDAAPAARRAACDLLVVGRGALGARPERGLARIRADSDAVDAIVLRAGDDPRERARLLAAGCLAVVDHEVADDLFRDALRSLVGRHMAGLARPGATRRPATHTLEALGARTAAMKQLIGLARRVAAADAPVLILGETGVGKERLARALHAEGPRARGPFVAVNCAALPEGLVESELFGHAPGAFTGADRARRGLFELAHGGTLFLDEVVELPTATQAVLLRALQDGEIRPVGAETPIRVDVRVLTATNRDLATEVGAGRFRRDLYYRLDVVSLAIPPLRERREDVPDLAQSLVADLAARLGRPALALSDAALESLLAHAWPGNVRELVHALERAALLCEGDLIQPADLGFLSVRPVSAGAAGGDLLTLPWHTARSRALEGFELSYLDALLRATDGRIGIAARQAGLSERALFSAMRRLGLRKEDYRKRVGPPVAVP